MVAELWMEQLLVRTLGFIMNFLGNRSWKTSSLDSQQEVKGIRPLNNGGVDDLESFQAWAEGIKTDMSRENPSLYEVLGEIVSSKQPIEERDILQASQRIKKEKQRTLRVLQARKEGTNFIEEKVHQLQPVDESKTTEADKLQIEHEGRQLGCLLVQKTKGETQLQVSRWLSATNNWEPWRQLNLHERSIHFKFLENLMNISFDTSPASCLQQLNARKEQMVRYQKFSGKLLPDFIKLTAVMNGLKGSVKSFVFLNLDGNSSFGDLDNLLARYFSMHDQHESSLDSLQDIARRGHVRFQAWTA